MNRWLLLLLSLSSSAVWGQAAWPDAATVAEVMRRANDYWITNNPAGNAGWARGAYYTGNQRAFRVLGERSYWSWATVWAGANQWCIGPEGPDSADAYCCGQTYIDLYRLDPQLLYLANIKSNIDALVASSAVDGWSWIDAFYMQAPVLARLGNLTGDTNYFQKLWLMYDDMKTRRGLFDPSASLWYRDESYTNALTPNGQKVFLSRGNGWVFAGLARVLQQMSTNAPHYQDYAAMFQTMAPALKAVQGADGMWRSSLYDFNQYTNPETSGTGFFTYGLAWGVRNDLLPAADYTNTLLLAWQGLTNLALNVDGRVGWVQGPAAQPGPATASSTTDFGVGAFLLACSEIYLLAPDAPAIRPWAGPDQTVMVTNGNTARISLSASQTEIYRGAALSYTWWDGTNAIASGVTAQTALTFGRHVITLSVLGSDGLTYTDAMTVTVTGPPVVAPPVAELRFDFEDSGTTTTDSVAGVTLDLVDANGAAADLHGAVGSGVGGAGRALDLTSAASQGGRGPLALTVGNSTVDFSNVTAFTVTLWIKPDSTLWVPGYPRFFSLGTNGTTDRGTPGSLQLLGNGNLQPASTAVQVFVNSLQSSTTAFGAFNMPAGQWRFLALTYDGTTLKFYGGSGTTAVALESATGFAAGPVALGNSWTLFLGNRLSRDRAFDGWLDDVRFYLGAASLEDLEAIRQQTPPPPRIEAGMRGAELELRLNTRAGLTYVLESRPELGISGNWAPVVTNTGTGGPITNVLPWSPADTHNFFRYRIR